VWVSAPGKYMHFDSHGMPSASFGATHEIVNWYVGPVFDKRKKGLGAFVSHSSILLSC